MEEIESLMLNLITRHIIFILVIKLGCRLPNPSSVQPSFGGESITRMPGAEVCSGGHSTMPGTGWHKRWKCVFSQFRMPGVLGQGAGPFVFWLELFLARRWLSSHCALTQPLFCAQTPTHSAHTQAHTCTRTRAHGVCGGERAGTGKCMLVSLLTNTDSIRSGSHSQDLTSS